jgi:hypothetical protein
MTVVRVHVRRVTGRVNPRNAKLTAQRVGIVEVTNLCRKIQNQATIDCPVDNGRLRSGHHMGVKVLQTKVKGRVYNDTSYAAAVHDGTRAYTIRARKKKALRFEAGGTVIFRKAVKHPATKGRPWLRDAAERVAQREGWEFTRTVVST